MKLMTLALCTLALSGCSSMMLKPYQGELKKTFIEETDLKKEESFERSSVWLAKNLGDSNAAIKINDAKNGRLVAKIIYACKGLKRPDVVGGEDSTPVKFDVDIAAKDKKVKYELEMKGFTRDLVHAGLGMVDYVIAEAPGQTEVVNACFENLKKDLKSALDKKSEEKSW
jgi:hypothetical protein